MFLTPSHPFKCLFNNVLIVHTAWENVILNRCCGEGKCCDHCANTTGWALTMCLAAKSVQSQLLCLQPQYLYGSNCNVMRSTTLARAVVSICNSHWCTLFCSGRLVCYIAKRPNPKYPNSLMTLIPGLRQISVMICI